MLTMDEITVKLQKVLLIVTTPQKTSTDPLSLFSSLFWFDILQIPPSLTLFSANTRSCFVQEKKEDKSTMHPTQNETPDSHS